MEKELTNINQEIYIVEIINLIFDMAMEVYALLMGMNIWVLGQEMNFKGKENISLIKKSN
jgi:hypothetical protein